MDSIPQKKIEQFGKQELNFLRLEIQNALDKIKNKYALSELSLGTINYTSSTFNAKINGAVQVADTIDFEMNEVSFFAMRHGLPQNLIECSFNLDGAIFDIINIEFRNPKFPVIAKGRFDGRIFKFTIPRIKELLDNHRVINIS